MDFKYNQSDLIQSQTEEIEKKENYMLLPPTIKEAEVLQPLEIIVTGKDSPYYIPESTVFFRGVEFNVQENKSVETSTTKSQRIKLILK